MIVNGMNLGKQQNNRLLMSKKKLRLDQNQIFDSKVSTDVFNLSQFNESTAIKIINNSPQSLEFDISGIDASVANALRRIMIAEVPTMAFHKVLLFQNTSVLPDELLVHRLGLLPVKADCKEFEERKDDEELSESNSLKFRLKIQCKRKEQYKKMTEEQIQARGLKPHEYLDNSQVYSKDLNWLPMGHQKDKFKNVKLVYDNILIAKLRQNQQIYLEIYAEKGTGKRHSKWSPVATAFYRLMPEITITPQFDQQKAQNLVNTCPVNVFKLKKNKAVVAEPRNCTTCRQCLKFDGVVLEKIKDHFIFTIETTGILTPEDIFHRALDILDEKAKCYSI